MTTPTGTRQDDPFDGSVRPFLWRLRARLVTPPPEDRVEADLDRLLVTARQHAHTAPSSGASSRPGSIEHPAPVPTRLATVTSFAGRLRGVLKVLGQVAAAAVIVAAVGAGALNAREGVVQIEALLGGARSDAEDPAAPPTDPTPEELLAAPVEPELPAEPAPEPPRPEPVPEPSVEEPLDPAPAPSTGDDAPAPPSGVAPAAPSPVPAPTVPSSPPDATPAPSNPEPSTPEPEPAPADPGEVIAAPAPGGSGLDGFGGQRPCDDDGLPCLPDAEDETGAGAQDPGAEDGAAEDAEELARRRYQPDDQS